MPKTLLSHLAHTLAPRPEEVATRSLAYFLNATPELPQALWSLLHGDKAFGWGSIHRFQAEYCFPNEGGRVDVAGVGSEGTPVLLEGKFWAGLTDNQPHGYLGNLQPGQDLVFVVPRARVLLLSNKLGFSEAACRSEQARMTNAHGRHVHVVSWQLALNTFKLALPASQDALRAEIDQLIGLCERMDEEGFLPLSESDLDPAIGRKIYQMSSLVDKVADYLKVKKDSPLCKPTKDDKWGGAGFNGRSMLVRDRGVWFNLYFSAFKWHTEKSVISPYWIDVKVNDPGCNREALIAYLESLGGRFIDRKDAMAVPVPMAEFLGLEESDTIRRFAGILESLASEIRQRNPVFAKASEADLPSATEEPL